MEYSCITCIQRKNHNLKINYKRFLMSLKTKIYFYCFSPSFKSLKPIEKNYFSFIRENKRTFLFTPPIRFCTSFDTILREAALHFLLKSFSLSAYHFRVCFAYGLPYHELLWEFFHYQLGDTLIFCHIPL